MKKKDFIHPVTEAVGVEGLQLLTPVSWNPDKGNGPSMGIIEGDPEGNGKGANEFALFDEDEDDSSDDLFGYNLLWD